MKEEHPEHHHEEHHQDHERIFYVSTHRLEAPQARMKVEGIDGLIQRNGRGPAGADEGDRTQAVRRPARSGL